MTAKHTPAPWRVSRADHDGAGVHAIACVAGCGVSSTYGQTPETTQRIDADECAANARLIAAAPEMLATLEKCIEVLQEMDICYVTRLNEEDGEVLLEACAVVAKAKGETP